MILSEVKEALEGLDSVNFKDLDGRHIPSHFHVTEVGKVEKHFIDCGGTERSETTISFQLWSDTDLDHRLTPKKLSSIIALSEARLHLEDLEVEVEYQSNTISRYGLDFDGKDFLLTVKRTDCLAKEGCGVSSGAEVSVSEQVETSCCDPKTGCC